MRRTVLVTGAGGAGVTTVAAATALAAVRDGHRAVLLSQGRLPAVLDGVAGLTLVRVDPAAGFRAAVLAAQRHGGGALDLLGAQPLDEDELTELPGTAHLALLHALRTARERAGPGDVLVADLPPAPDGVALLGLPAQLARYLRRLLPPDRQAARALRPVLAQLAGVPMPAQWLYESAGRWQEALAAVREVLDDPGTSARLVVAPVPGAPAAVAESRAGLALHGTPLDAVIVNRMLPAGVADAYLDALRGEQRAVADELRAAPHGPPPLELPWLPAAPATPDDLAALGVPGPGAPPPGPAPRIADRRTEDGELVWRLPLPGAVRERVALVRRGDEVIVTAGPHRRALPLDGALSRCAVAGARLADGGLTVRFRPDPALWPEGS
ncbi:ArsA-related P-loop ATPase [Streptomyces sp. TRM 70351]|uniref:ArsA family ATPase n=1 Tax=Streptomyces sp. TRM 70351 TaxID=3116552 RepID=UPI002E7BDC29|nr:ArsA-related P-loop ATPase [Streptomyces sp. TRM 70351]MEE1928701.1 ArsA-related P-loop ATPase [Streptomyces sp. TRM 70351]